MKSPSLARAVARLWRSKGSYAVGGEASAYDQVTRQMVSDLKEEVGDLRGLVRALLLAILGVFMVEVVRIWLR